MKRLVLGHLRKQMLLFENTMAEPEELVQQAQQPTQYETAGTHDIRHSC